MRENVLAIGTQVRFRLKDVYCPEIDKVLQDMTERLEMTGKVLYLSDSGKLLNHYAVVEVRGLTTPVVVPSASVNIHKVLTEEIRY